MKIFNTKIKDLKIIQHNKFVDNRGFLKITFHNKIINLQKKMLLEVCIFNINFNKPN